MFRSLAVGLALSVVVILVLLTGYFQSFRLGLISIGGVPGVILGVATILLLTGTTLNIESFMGSIMCIGVSVSNSVLLSTFMDDHWKAGASVRQAAIEGARDRLRPILMTASAMILGTLPMALALEEGSGMTAPLGRAVIGGLLVSTFATLLIVPSMFVIIMGEKKKVSPSLDPDDPSSRQYDAAGHEPDAIHGGPRPDEYPTFLAETFTRTCVIPPGLDEEPLPCRESRRRETAVSWSSWCLPAWRPCSAAAARKRRPPKPTASGAPTVHVVRPTRRTIDYAVDQPGFVYAFEQTAIYSKVTGFIKHWDVDIGQEVKKGDLLAEIDVPELKEEHVRMVAQVDLDKSNVKMAAAQLNEAKADVGKYQAEVVRWKSEVDTFDRNGEGEGRR